MNRIFVISDTHFNHSRILEFEKEKRPFSNIYEHDKELIRRWNDTVGPKDTVWHLGDVLFGQQGFKLLYGLNGRKHLVMGNHDKYPIKNYLEHFVKVCSAHVYDGCILTHIPIHPSQFYRFKCNIHGHLHSRTIDDERYINVSCEHTGLKPVLLKEILEKHHE